MRNLVTRVNVFLSLILLVTIIAVGCGGGSMSHVPGVPTAVAAAHAARNLFRSTALPSNGSRMKATTTTTSGIHWSYSGVAYAQAVASSVTITGVSNGFCTSQPGQNASAPTTFEYFAYGAGQLDSSKCENEWVLDDTLAAQNATNSLDIVGNQTLHGFVIRVGAGTGSGINGKVLVIRQGQVLPTPFTCAAPANVNATECQDGTDTFPVLDHDKVVVILSGNRGDTYQNIKWFLGAE